MEAFLDTLKNLNFNYTGIPIGKIIAAIVILTLTQTLRRFLVSGIIKGIERFTRQTQTRL
jgi:MscS family membrane protein